MTEGASVIADELRRLAHAVPTPVPRTTLAADVLRLARRRRRSNRTRMIFVFAVLLIAASIAATVPGRNPRFAMTQPSSSMEPVILVSERVEFDRRLQPLRGDIVAARIVDDGGEYDSIRRVVALGDDTVACPADPGGACSGLEVNGVRVDEPYLGGVPMAPFAPTVVPQGAVFLLGDDRNNSMDSRQLGPVDRAAVAGVAVAIVGLDGQRRPVPGAPERPVEEALVDPPPEVPPARAATPPGGS